MVADIRFIPFPDSVRVVGPDAARRAGCAAGTWLDTPRGQMWETLVTPIPPPLMVHFPPGADLDELRRQHPEAGDRGILFVPQELTMPPSADRHFRLRASQQFPGDHVRVGIWAGTAVQAGRRARPKLGALVMDADDWRAFVRLMTWCPSEGVEVDTSGLLDFEGTGSSDADAHRMGFRGYEGCPRRDCPTPGLCAEKGDCLEDDDPPKTDRIQPPGTLAEYHETDQADVFDPDDDRDIVYTGPCDLDRVWITLTGAVTPRPGSTGWAITLIVNDRPLHLVTEDWRPGVDLAPVQFMGWFPSTPGEAYRFRVRLDGADWQPSPLIPVTLRVSDRPSASPWAPATFHLTDPAQDREP